MENRFDGVRQPIVSVGCVQFRHGQEVRVYVVGEPALAEFIIAPDVERHLHIPHWPPQCGGILLGQAIQIDRTRTAEFDHSACVDRWVAQDLGGNLGDIGRGDWRGTAMSEGQADRSGLLNGFGGPAPEQEILLKHRWSQMHHRQTRPIKRLLATPMQPLLQRLGHVPQIHLRDSHL